LYYNEKSYSHFCIKKSNAKNGTDVMIDVVEVSLTL